MTFYDQYVETMIQRPNTETAKYASGSKKVMTFYDQYVETMIQRPNTETAKYASYFNLIVISLRRINFLVSG